MTADDTRPLLTSDVQHRVACLRLLRSENVGPATFRALIDRYGEAGPALEALPVLSARGGSKRPIRICSQEQAEAELMAAERLGLTLVIQGEPAFPEPLLHTEGGPPLIYVAGKSSILGKPAVAIVGARNCSAAGRRLAGEIAGGLAAAGIVVVSGLARGIDAAAHRASIESGTIAVLASGHGRLYPPEHAELADEITVSGALVSEMPPDWTARARDFPRRNRIISGLSLGVVVIEAAARSGSLITARFALEQGREVFAVPGSPLDPRAEAAARSGSLITARFALEQGREVFAVPGSPLDPRAEGANRLIRQGAILARSADDVLETLETGLRVSRPLEVQEEPDTLPPYPEDIGNERDRIAEALGPAPVEIDELVRHTGLPVGIVMQAIIELELAGRLDRHPGQRVSLAPSP
jgi:DNA processing protein